MSTNVIIFGLVTFLHNLFTVIWIGGLIVLGITVLPAVQTVMGQGLQSKQLMDTIQRRQSLLVYVSIVGLIVRSMLWEGSVNAITGATQCPPASTQHRPGDWRSTAQQH